MLIHVLGLLLALLPTYLIRFHILSFPTTFLELLIVVFLFATVIQLKVKDLNKLKSLGKINWAIALFVIAGIISVFISPETLRALGQLKAFIIEPVLLFYAAVILIKNEKSAQTILRWLLVGASVVSMFAVIQYFTFLNLPPRFWGGGEEMLRVISFFEHPNQLALYLAPLFVLYFGMLINGYEIIKQRWFYFALISIFIAIILTFSRGAWMGVLFGILIIVLKKYSYKKLIIPAVLGLLVILFITPVRERIGAGLGDASSIAHKDLMMAGVNKIIDNPLFGNGLYGFRTTLEQSNFPGEVINYPHNIILNFWVEMGLFGLLGFALIFYFAAQQYKKHPTTLKFAAGMFLITLVIHGLVDIPYLKNDLAVMFWFVVSLFYLKSSQ